MTTTSSPSTTIKIGDVRYDIDVSKIPSFVDFQANAQPQSTKLVHDPIPLFDIALKGIQSGYRQCFCSLPADFSQHRILCTRMIFSALTLLAGHPSTRFSGI